MTAPLDQFLAPQAQSAMIAGLFLAAGWWVVALQNRRRDNKHRAERIRDVQRAIFAEIRAYIAVLERDRIAEYGEEIARRIESETGYFPVIPTEHNDAIFRAIVGELHILPRGTVDPVVLYYSQLNAIGAMIADLRGLDLDRIGPERAGAMYRDYISMKLGAIELGEAAMTAIRSNIDGTGRISSPDGDRSGP
ncbi:hypothetical protein SAMN05421538_102496 [Paracoccus isoporae]|uniref:Uncharacterized protein n=1 Tax=Paracoccus isoporae TaxID=591205 RepID=A0A1G6XTR4_9RHOB|nr:hypothetical protein [Paracoccus isoporae]SDD81530.1 hypothetical protein SAMN05421538_102496 [Paracoccus isoporae]